jgi:hypothetical protein
MASQAHLRPCGGNKTIRRVRILVLLLPLVAACSAPEPTALRFLQANVGTALLSCDAYAFKLCDGGAEAAIAGNITALDVDVIALQEILPDAVCAAIDADGGEADPRRSCHPDVRAAEPTQLKRLLPDDTWETRCDDRNGYECVAVRRERATFVGAYETGPEVDPVLDCDSGFSVGRVDVQLGDDGDAPIVRVVNGHPQSTKDTCRKAQVEQVFETLATDDDGVAGIIVSGDMNLDPFSLGLNADDVSVPVWSAYVGDADDDRPFIYASGTAERSPPYATTTTLIEATLDHVAVRGLSGTCTTLGAAPGTTPLDGEADVMDHRALDCELTLLAP